MISLTCNNCRATLEVDDAFAGSACRCQHCGAIQTVPGRKRAAAPAATPGGGTSGKTLYAQPTRGAAAGPGSGSGLDQLADVVSSSGLGSGLDHAAEGRRRRTPDGAARSGPALAPARRAVPAWVIIVGALGLVLVAVVMTALVLRRPGVPTVTRAPTPGPSVSAAPGAPSPSPAAGPRGQPVSFAGLDLPEPTVVFVIDRGSSARESIGHILDLTLKTLRIMGPDRKFQVLFWDNGQGDIAYPSGAPAYATPEAIATARRTLDGVVAFGRSDAAPALARAFAAKPAAVVIVTAKGWELDDAFTASVIEARGKGGASAAKVHVLSIGEGSESLERLARMTGGQYKSVEAGELRSMSAD